MSTSRTCTFEPKPEAFAARCSWWADSPRSGFTNRAWAEWGKRMRFTRYAGTLTLTRGPMGPGTLDKWKAKKALEASR